MACEWELVTTGLQAYLDALLKAAYTADCFAEDVTSGAHNWTELAPSFTPALAIWQGPRSQPDPDAPSYHRSVRLLALIRRKDAVALLMQTEGNKLERLIDSWLSGLTVLNGIPCSAWQANGQMSTVYGGEGECTIEYDFTLRYRESIS